VLAGDHCQLPPTDARAKEAAANGLGISMMERLLQVQPITPSTLARRLDIQYRMHDSRS
jgi:superfamily I DNA and/or RNA helicase